MTDEIMTNETMETDYVAAIEEMKRNTVSRDQFNKMKEENRKLLNALTNGQEINQTIPTAPKKTIEELSNILMNGSNDNLVFWQTSLERRERMLEEGYEDPWVPKGKKITATREDYESAQRVADGVASCIEYAAGDSEIFTQELQRITRDTAMPRRKR